MIKNKTREIEESDFSLSRDKKNGDNNLYKIDQFLLGHSTQHQKVGTGNQMGELVKMIK